MRGAIRKFIEATTHHKVCDEVDNDLSAVHKAMEARCDLVLLNLRMPLQDSLVTVSLLRSKLPSVKIVGFSTLSVDLENWVSPGIGLDAIVTDQDGLSKLVETLRALMPEPHLPRSGLVQSPYCCVSQDPASETKGVAVRHQTPRKSPTSGWWSEGVVGTLEDRIAKERLRN